MRRGVWVTRSLTHSPVNANPNRGETKMAQVVEKCGKKWLKTIRIRRSPYKLLTQRRQKSLKIIVTRGSIITRGSVIRSRKGSYVSLNSLA